MYGFNNQQIPMQINFQQPFQQSYNNAFRRYSDYEIERNMRLIIEQDMLREYDFIIQEAYLLINEVYKFQGNSLTRDSNNIYLSYDNINYINQIDQLEEIETELSPLMSRQVKIITDTKTIVNLRRTDPHKIYIPLFLINSKIEPILLFDIYDDTKDNNYSYNLFTYTEYLKQRFQLISELDKNVLHKVYEDAFKPQDIKEENNYNRINNEFFIKLFLRTFTLNNNSEYIEEWLTYFFKTLRRIKNNLILIGNRDISEETFYIGIIKQIFGFDYCLTITDEILENQPIEFIIQNKLFLHINHIPESKENQKKLKELLENLIVYDGRSDLLNTNNTPFLCQIIFTLEQPHPFLDDFLSHSKVFFIDSIDNINLKLNQPDRISLLNSIAKNLISFSTQLASVDLSKLKNYSNQYEYIDLMQQEVTNQRAIHYSNKIIINDTVSFKEKNYETDNELFKNWLKNPKLMKIALSSNSKNPILDPFDNSFESILPNEERYKHTYVTGKTGSGKSELLKTLIYRDILNEDCSVILLDIHGDLAKDVTRLVKDKERLILIDPILEKDFTPTINLFETDDKSEENIEQVSQMISSVINSISIDDKLSGTMMDVLENCIPLLIRNNNRDFYDLKNFMKTINKEKQNERITIDNHLKSDDPKYNELVKLALNSKNEFEKDYFNNEFINIPASTKNAVKRRLNKILKDSKFSNLTNGKSKIDLQKMMNTKGKIIIFNIPKSKMLSTYTYYIKFIIGLIQIIALKRADIKDEKKRPHTHLYIDEFHNFLTPTIEEILAESRKYKLFLTLAHQSVSQIKDSNLRDIILDNTNIKIIGKNSNKTLEMMNKTLNTKLENVEKLETGEFYIQSGTNDVIKIKNTTKLLNGNEGISNEEWEEHKQYQLENYYRSTIKEEDEVKNEVKFYEMIDEFIQAIKTQNLSDGSCLKKIEQIEPKRFEEIEADFNFEKDGIKQPRIRQQEINIVFQLAFGQDKEIDNRKFSDILKPKDTMFKETETMSQDKKYRNKTQEKYYLIQS